MAKVDASIILPCYNEGPTLEKSVAKIVNVCESLKKRWEIIFVEDKSVDGTRKTVEKICLRIKNTKAIYHEKNQGRGKSVADGIRAAEGEICGYLDVDLEVPAQYIPIFIEEIENGRDLVVGRRFYEGGYQVILRYLASKIYAMIVKTLLDTGVQDSEAGYKFFRTAKILPILVKTRDKRWFWDTEICARAKKAGLVISEVPVLFKRRTDKKSTVKLFTDTWDYLVSIIKFKLNER